MFVIEPGCGWVVNNVSGRDLSFYIHPIPMCHAILIEEEFSTVYTRRSGQYSSRLGVLSHFQAWKGRAQDRSTHLAECG